MIIIIIFFHNHVYKKSQLEMYNPEGIAIDALSAHKATSTP